MNFHVIFLCQTAKNAPSSVDSLLRQKLNDDSFGGSRPVNRPTHSLLLINSDESTKPLSGSRSTSLFQQCPFCSSSSGVTSQPLSTHSKSRANIDGPSSCCCCRCKDRIIISFLNNVVVPPHRPPPFVVSTRVHLLYEPRGQQQTPFKLHRLVDLRRRLLLEIGRYQEIALNSTQQIRPKNSP